MPWRVARSLRRSGCVAEKTGLKKIDEIKRRGRRYLRYEIKNPLKREKNCRCGRRGPTRGLVTPGTFRIAGPADGIHVCWAGLFLGASIRRSAAGYDAVPAL
jgi:hypothetical protein